MDFNTQNDIKKSYENTTKATEEQPHMLQLMMKAERHSRIRPRNNTHYCSLTQPFQTSIVHDGHSNLVNTSHHNNKAAWPLKAACELGFYCRRGFFLQSVQVQWIAKDITWRKVTFQLSEHDLSKGIDLLRGWMASARGELTCCGLFPINLIRR